MRAGSTVKGVVMIALLFGCVTWLPIQADATVTYDLDFVFSGQQPGNPPPTLSSR
jgi:hypothetical protein